MTHRPDDLQVRLTRHPGDLEPGGGSPASGPSFRWGGTGIRSD